MLALLQDLNRQEAGAEEDVHRTSPFFATALRLIMASLSYSATQLPSWSAIVGACRAVKPPVLPWFVVPCAWPALLTGVRLVCVVCLSVAVLVFLGLATRKGDYMRLGPEANLIDGTRQIHAHYVGQGADDVDNLVLVSVREQLLEPLARAAAANREATQERYHDRARAVACLRWSLFFGLLATTPIVVTTKFGSIKALP
jgi:hypothetical protein